MSNCPDGFLCCHCGAPGGRAFSVADICAIEHVTITG